MQPKRVHYLTLFFSLLATQIFGAMEAPEGAKGKPGGKYGKAIYHRSFMARIKKGPIGVLFLGDSITENMLSKGKETFYDKFTAYQPACFGVGGEDNEHLLYRLTTGELNISVPPKVVVLLIGVNNISHTGGKISAEKVAEGIKANVDEIRAKLPTSKLLLISVLPFGKTTDSPNHVRVLETNKIIQKFADGKNIIYVDVYNKIMNGAKETPLDLMPDALHPNEKGYEVFYNALWPVMEPLLK